MVVLSPQVVFTLFSLQITDTVVSTWVMMLLIIILAIIIKRFKPDLGEMIVEFINSIVRSVMAEDKDVTNYLPILGTLGIFLLVANNFGIFPRMVSPTANINTTIALSMIVFFTVHVYGIKEKGLWGYIKDFAKEITIEAIKDQLNDAENYLKGQNKDLDKLEKNHERELKNIENWEKDIENSKKEIKNIKEEKIEKKIEIGVAKESVNAIRKKLVNIK